ncbi:MULTISPECIES: 4'-phosphopantetheinyl transferase family protein [unclassified Cryobacterium]|uniref:4'-phosphopantetheinyl transferase family protein n=1 Tax=unclassified Cryobacterium TaxID=2649013 RepID=UPI002AB4242A|nr:MULTISPECIES: 4'-phosphopantetheinyl transferase superfamily protein [unclassified Cryobacterium]MDY7528800.1 4'-phosphopantetheinyl transferase superfamily protein [Cryobacterium sp. 10C2]MEB0200995.1 4'-phosphopantetheinyl transferase superfamily protein [Cryobacterium sp. 5I3]MEB0285229.1 4'-phosphopantetheinyl transferase superfamily protein [Cryobacterium sp. 10S3]MEB0290860.1 4'-phosphopantetheinyl transferase superfamily protein [Cryobacterium sp. 10C2]MEB0306240.1 4'-phosphopantethe
MESIGEVIVMVAPRSPTDAADRAVLAAAAAWALGLDPASVRVCRRCPHCGSAEHGVPSLAAVTSGSAPHPTVHLSLSRASGHVAVAVSFAGPVGVDVESVDAVARSPLADVALSPRERAANAADLAGIWCAKEAILKSTGDGLRVDPRDLTLAPAPTAGFGPALASWPGAGVALAGILLASFDPGAGLGLVGRVAVLARPGTGPASQPALRLLAAPDVRAWGGRSGRSSGR